MARGRLTILFCLVACTVMTVFAQSDKTATPEQLYKNYLANLGGGPGFNQGSGKTPVTRTTFEEALKAGIGLLFPHYSSTC